MASRFRKLFSCCSAEQESGEESYMGNDIAAAGNSSQMRAFTLDEFFQLLMMKRLQEEKEEDDVAGEEAVAAAAAPDSSPEAPALPAEPRQWRCRPQPSGRGRAPSGLRQIFRRFTMLFCTGDRGQQAEPDVEEEESHAPAADTPQEERLFTLEEYLRMFMEQQPPAEARREAHRDAEDSGCRTSSAVPLAAGRGSESCLHLRWTQHTGRVSKRRASRGASVVRDGRNHGPVLRLQY